LAAALICLSVPRHPGFAAAPVVASGPTLSLNGYHVTFDDEFSTLSISAHRPGTRWIAHTPWNGDFGNAIFSNPNSGVFSAGPNGLTITAFKDASGKWRSGLICSLARDGDATSGFTQEYGYFEMEAKLPAGMGTWPGFWLIGFNKSQYTAEIDVIEFYGGFPGLYHTTLHYWHDRKGDERLVSVPPGILSSQFNRFGVLITPRTTTFYFNRQPYWSLPTPPEFQQPFYILANLALGGGWPIKGLTPPVKMQIHYIKAWQQGSPQP
jgi:beta-glucanase (GH16 family)